jgi:hypothetical protein
MCTFRLIQGSNESSVNCIIKTPPTFKICPDLAKFKLVDKPTYLGSPSPIQKLRCLSCENLPLIVVGVCDCQSERDLDDTIDIGMEYFEPDDIVKTLKEPGSLAA